MPRFLRRAQAFFSAEVGFFLNSLAKLNFSLRTNCLAVT
jgi:hypothetical protein